MKERVGQKIKLTNYEALLGVSNEESAVDVSIRDIHIFENHPFISKYLYISFQTEKPIQLSTFLNYYSTSISGLSK